MLIKCKICNKDVSSLAKNCPHCGACLPIERQCPECGSISSGETEACDNCGYPFKQRFRPAWQKTAILTSFVLLLTSIIAFFPAIDASDWEDLIVFPILGAHFAMIGFLFLFHRWRLFLSIPSFCIILLSMLFSICFMCERVHEVSISAIGFALSVIIASIELYWIVKKSFRHQSTE